MTMAMHQCRIVERPNFRRTHTLCGRSNARCSDGMNIAETADQVTCKFCRAIMEKCRAMLERQKASGEASHAEGCDWTGSAWSKSGRCPRCEAWRACGFESPKQVMESGR